MKKMVCAKPQTLAMRLRTEPFRRIQSGKKRVELRLADEKRSKLRIGDILIFMHTENQEETLRVRVTDLRKYENFDQIQKDFCLEDLGFDTGTGSLGDLMREYYSDSDVQTYGVLAIGIEREN